MKMSSIPNPAKCVINGDSVNWMINIMYDGTLGCWTWYEPQVDQNLPKQLIIDNGAPNRHGGAFADLGAIKPAPPYATWVGPGNIVHSPAQIGQPPASPQNCRANYLFLDGHAETLSSDVALRR